MEKLISCCGINCATCEARIATINNDNALREKTAEQWRQTYNPNITADMINCTGCREEGVKIGHHASCQIRICARNKGFKTCGFCESLSGCETISFVLQNVPDAIENLKLTLN